MTLPELQKKALELVVEEYIEWEVKEAEETGGEIGQLNMSDKLEELITPLLEQAYAAGRSAETASKNSAYRERNMLVAALARLFPAYLARHDSGDLGWEKDWMWIVYIDLPTGQVSWHIHDSELHLFKLEVKENNWDGHNTERKYERLRALRALKPLPD